MTKLLEGKTVLVTGGGVGIGRQIVKKCSELGARVAFTYLSHSPGADSRGESVSGLSSQATAIRADFTSEQEVASAIATVVEELGGLDILVNNVGGLIKRSDIESMSYSLWRTVMAVNLDSLFIATHYAIPILRDGGRIINIASLAGRSGGHAGATAYATAKAGIFGFTRGLAKELGARRITVNAVAPGFIEDTPFHDTFTTADSKAQTISGIPLGRAGRPEDVAGAVVWLASDLAEFVSGSILDVNGAQYFG